MSKYIDYKVTVWRRIELPDEAPVEEVVELIKKGHTPNTIYEIIDDKYGEYGMDDISLPDTEEFIKPDMNDGCATIELFEDETELITTNVL